MKIISLVFFAVALLAKSTPQFNDELTQGIAAYRAGRIVEAAAHFQQATELDPSNVEAHLYLATAYMSQWIPGADRSDNQRNHDRAVAQFRAALDKDPKNYVALASLAGIAYHSSISGTPEQRSASLDEAAMWNKRRIDANPNDSDAYYYLGVIAWSQTFSTIQQARIQANMKPSDPGPLTDLNARIDLQTRYSKIITDGIANLKKCLELEPKNDDAMSYLNLLLRKKADLEDSAELSAADIAEANECVVKSLDMKKAKASQPSQANGSAPASSVLSAPPPPPPPFPPQPRTSSYTGPVRIGGQVAEANLIRRVPPAYPPAAQSAGIQGSVKFTVFINPDGSVESTQLVRGNPSLATAAKEALLQWRYRPVLLNGKPVAIITDVVINFTLN